MKFFRHALFAFLLLLAQSGALTHSVEHLRGDADAPASHSCALCIAAHGLDAPLAAPTPDVALPTADFAQPVILVASFFAATPLAPRARAPPAA